MLDSNTDKKIQTSHLAKTCLIVGASLVLGSSFAVAKQVEVPCPAIKDITCTERSEDPGIYKCTATSPFPNHNWSGGSRVGKGIPLEFGSAGKTAKGGVFLTAVCYYKSKEGGEPYLDLTYATSAGKYPIPGITKCELNIEKNGFVCE